METQYISLNMTPTGVNPCFHISQYDVGRMLGFIVHSGGATVDLDTYTCTIEATRSDGTAITSAVATTDNIGTFEVTPTMSNKADKYRCQLIIVDENSKRIASLPFDMEVTKAAMDENSEAIEEDASLYQQYTEAVQGAIAEANADIQAEENARIAAVNAEATARANADATLQNNINAEATARQTADNTLQGNINSEASTRASADSNLQSQINQIVAPSGEAPSAAEVQNARIGADGVTYDTLGNAIRGQVTDLKSAISQYIGMPDLIAGGYILNDGRLHTDGGANDRYTTFIRVKKGNVIEVFAKGNSNTNALSFYYDAVETSYAEGVPNNQSTHFFYTVAQDGYVRFYFTVTAEQLSTVTIIIYTSADVYADELRKLNNTGHDVLPYTFRFGYWQNQTYHFDLAHYCTSELITVPTDIDIYAAEDLRCSWDLIENGSYVRTYGITSSNSPRTIPAGTYHVSVSKENGNNVTIHDIRFGMTVGTDVWNNILNLYEHQKELQFNEMFSRQAALSLGNYPDFQVSGTDIIITFSGNVFVTKKASASAVYAYDDLGGSYTVPTNSYCVINMTTGTVQVLTSAELFSSTDEFVVLFYNNYGYPKFGWGKYWNPYQIDLRFNERFSRQAVLSLGNTPKFKVNGTSIIVTFSGNVFITKQLSASTLYNFNNLGGTYTVPASSYCVINMTTGTVQVLTSAELFASTDEIVVLFFNQYGYPKFGWEKYWTEQNIREDEYDDLTAYPYEGEKISFDPVLTYDEVLSLSKGYSQGGACYGDYLFQFHSQNQVPDADFHGCTVANLTSREEIQFINLGYDVNIHNNNASFGTVKYSDTDAFPLLYVSQESENARNILVYRVTGNAQDYALSQIQTITVPNASEWPVTYPNACVGDDGYLYIVGYKSDNQYEVLKYSLPNASVSAVQLSYADAISSIIIEVDTNIQGFMVYGGKLYATAGASSYSIMGVFSLSSGSLLSKITFNNVGLPYEPEAIFMHNGVACITFAVNNCTIYRFKF